MTNILISVPSGDMLHADFSMSLLNLTLYSFQNKIHVGVSNPRFSLVQIGRCEAVKSALSMNIEYLMFLDSDMVFPSDTLVRLASHGLPVVCCDASTRREPFQNVLMKTDGAKIDHSKNNPNLIEVMGASAACMLIRKDVLEKIKEPYFHVTFNHKNEYLGEDYYFSNKVRQAGYSIYCDTKLSKQIGHIGNKTYYVNQGE